MNRKEPQESKPTEYKAFPFEITNLDFEGRTLEGYVSIFGNLDSGGDIVHKGAFSKTLKERGGKVKFLWQHDSREPLGRPLELQEDNRGLFVKAIVSKTRRGLDTLELLRDGAINEFSIGYDAIKGGTDYSEGADGSRIRNLREIKLYEFSLVTFAMNEEAQVTGLKEQETQEGDSPSEGKPWNVFPVNDEFCVFKIDEDGNRTGDSLGCHSTEEEARQQVEALYANEPEADGKQMAENDASTVVPAETDDEKGDDKGAAGKANWPLASRDRAWDNSAAEGRIRSWAGAEDAPNAKYRSCHFWYDAENADNFTAYKLLFCDVVDGNVQAIPRGLFAVAAVLQGARGGANIPAADQATIKGKVGRYYARMREEFDDDSIVPPWDEEGKALNLTRQLDDIRAAFDNQYNSPNGPWDWWVMVVWDEYIIVQYDGDAGIQYFQVPYTLGNDDKPEFAPRGEWVEGEYEFTPMGKGKARAILQEAMAEMQQMLANEEKAGRVLAARNATRIASALTALIDVLEDAGVDIPGYGKESPDDEAGPEEPPEKSDDGPDESPTSVDTDEANKLRNQARTLELEMELMQMTTEV